MFALPRRGVYLARVNRKTKLPDFEQSLTELEALVAKLEQGDVPLEQALKTFERGVALTRQCQTALRKAQQKVEVLLTRNGEETFESFSGAEDDSDDDSRCGLAPGVRRLPDFPGSRLSATHRSGAGARARNRRRCHREAARSDALQHPRRRQTCAAGVGVCHG